MYSKFIVSCLHAPTKFQINAISDDALDKVISEEKIAEEVKNKLKTLFEEYRLSQDQIKNKVIELGD
jgi:replication initiation and membrane attachment protein DnaB